MCYVHDQGLEELIEALGVARDTQVPVPSWHYEEAQARTEITMPLHEALSLCYDLRCACYLVISFHVLLLFPVACTSG
jgi:hypothetical protein